MNFSLTVCPLRGVPQGPPQGWEPLSPSKSPARGEAGKFDPYYNAAIGYRIE